MSAPQRIILFDIDGTLLLTAGAGLRAMSRTFRDLFGLDGEGDPLDGIDFTGRSDRYIVQAVLERHGLRMDAAASERFLDGYAAALTEEVSASKGALLPGVVPLLQALEGEPAVVGLGTGNFRRTGMIKLDHFGIGRYFVDGGFGDDSPLRPELLAAGLKRLQRHAAPGASVVVVGDTVHDITAGHAIGARVVAVATGGIPVAELEAAGADLTLPDCADLATTLAALLD